MRKLLFLVAAIACLNPMQRAQAQATLSRERTLSLVQSCRYFVRENVPDGAEFPNLYDELPTIRAKGKTYGWDDRVKIKTPLYVSNKAFVCTYNPATDKINIRWKG